MKKKIILELPTYPYDLEIKKDNIFTKLDKKYRLNLYKYVDRIVTYSDDEEIFGIKTIKISNGIDIEKISIASKLKFNNNEINFISVAQIAFWHGIDRFILSMAEYYKNNPKEIIKFHIVGDGDKKIINNLKEIVRVNKLEEYVIFYGYKSGQKLDEIYSKSDIGVGGLAAFKQGLISGSALKNREYCAKGLPFIISYIDKGFNNQKFVYQVSNDESLFDLNKIIDWYKNLKMTSQSIRKYAEDNLTWDKQMKKVIDYILETEEKEKC